LKTIFEKVLVERYEEQWEILLYLDETQNQIRKLAIKLTKVAKKLVDMEFTS